MRKFFRPHDDNLCLWRGGLYIVHQPGSEKQIETLLDLAEERRLDICVRGRRNRTKQLMEHLETVLLCCKKTLEAACPRLRLCTGILSVASLSLFCAGGRDRMSFPAETVCKAERCGVKEVSIPGVRRKESVMELLYAGDESLSLSSVGVKAHIMHLDSTIIDRLNEELSKEHPHQRDWRLLAQHLALGDQMELFNVKPEFAAARVLEKFAESPKATIKSLISLIRDKVGRTNVAARLDEDVQKMLRAVRNPAPQSGAGAAFNSI